MKAGKDGTKLLVLGVYSTNHIALHVYRKAGFKEVGHIPKYFCEDDKFIDEAIMAKML